MVSTRNFLIVALTAFTAVQAVAVEGDIVAVAREHAEMLRRQKIDVSATIGGNDPTSSSEKPAPTSTKPSPTTTTDKPTPTTTDGPTNGPTSNSNPAPTSSSSDTDKSPTTTSPPPNKASTTEKAPEPTTSTVTFTSTLSDGTITTGTSKTVITPDPTAGLNTGNSGGSQAGMTPKTRNTIIGVVVGVGGAIALAVIGLVAYRIWGRRKSAEENDGLMDYGPGYNANEAKSDAGAPSTVGTGRSPFQSTLESYHAPTQVNTASNF